MDANDKQQTTDRAASKAPRVPRRLRATVKGGFSGSTHGIFFDDRGVSREAVSEADEARLREAFPAVRFEAYTETKTDDEK